MIEALAVRVPVGVLAAVVAMERATALQDRGTRHNGLGVSSARDHAKRVTTAHPGEAHPVGVNSISPSTRARGSSTPGRSGPAPPRLIGVGVDRGASARDAVALASLLARTTGAELMLVAVHEEPLIEFVSPAEMSWTTRQRQAWATLVETRDSLAPESRITVQPDVLVWRALRHVARREHRDLLVVGSGHHATHGHVRIGTRAAGLFDRLECPLAIAPRGMRTHEQPRLERIGVGYEGEPEALAALGLAESIARTAGAELSVQAVIDDRTPVGLPTEDLVPVGESIVENQTRLLLAEARAAVSGSDVPARLEVSRAKPADALSALGAGVDLLVIGSRRSGQAGRISLGSTGSSLANGAPCAVIIVPKPRDPAAV